MMDRLAAQGGADGSSDFSSLVEMLLAEHQRVLDENRSLRQAATQAQEASSTSPWRGCAGGGRGRAPDDEEDSARRRVSCGMPDSEGDRVSFGMPDNASGSGESEADTREMAAPAVAAEGSVKRRVSFGMPDSQRDSGELKADTRKKAPDVSRMHSTGSADSVQSGCSSFHRGSQGLRSDRARALEQGMEMAVHKQLQETMCEKFGISEGGEDAEITAEKLAEVLGLCSTEPFDVRQLEELMLVFQSLAPRRPIQSRIMSRMSFRLPFSHSERNHPNCDQTVIFANVLVSFLVSEETYWSIPEHLQPLLLRVHRCLATDTQDAQQVIAKLLTQSGVGSGLTQSDFWQDATRNISNPEVVFKVVSSCAVIASSALVGVATALDWDGWPIVESCIAFYFLFEMLWKFKLFGCREYWWGPERYWNIFDAVVTVVSLADAGAYLIAASTASKAGSIEILRTLRMVRAIRVLRLLRMPMMRQLALMLDGFVEGLRTLFWAGLLLLVLFYILAVTLTQITSANEVGEAAEMFTTVPRAMDTLFRCLVATDCTMPDGRPISADMARAYGWTFVIGHWAVVLVMHFGVGNLINAIFVENTIAAARLNQDKLRRRRISETRRVANILLGLVRRYTTAAATEAAKQSGARAKYRTYGEALTKVVFNKVNEDPQTQTMYEELGVPEDDLENLFDTLDIDGNGELSVCEIVQGIINLRGPARRSDALFTKMALRNMQKSSRDFYLVALRHMDTLEQAQNELMWKVTAMSDKTPGAAEQCEAARV